MAEIGKRPEIGTSQKRLTVVVSGLALLGSIVLGLIWWDSLVNVTVYASKTGTICCYGSGVLYSSESIFSGLDGYLRTPLENLFGYNEWLIFPTPLITHGAISIPIYLLILAYLSTLLLVWLILMNRLARREFAKR